MGGLGLQPHGCHLYPLGVTDLSDLAIGKIDLAALKRLIAAGEAGGVERKAEMPQDALASSAAAFANTSGGWLLVGVRDDGSIAGWAPPGNAHIHDYLRERLRHVIDPLPGFDAQLLQTPDGTVGVIRIPASPLRPHVLRGKGVIYEREPGGNRPIDSQAKLVAMTTRPAQAEAEATHRLTQLPMVAEAVHHALNGPAANGQTRTAEWIVAATPLAVPPHFADRVLGGDCLRTLERQNANALRVLTEGSSQRYATTQPRPRGLVIDGGDQATREVAQLTIDAGGVVVVRWSQRLFRGVEHLPALMDRTVAPLLTLALNVLMECGGEGPTKMHGYLRIRATDPSWDAVLGVAAAGQHGELAIHHGEPIALGADVELPADGKAIREQTDRWMAELGRHAGMSMWG